VRAIRGKVGIVVALALAVALAASMLAGLGSGRAASADDSAEPWGIALSYPEGDWSSCLDDPAVLDGLTSADIPVSRVTARSAPGATEADLRRIVDCLSSSMTGGSIDVGTSS